MEPESEYEAQRRKNREALQREFVKVFGQSEPMQIHHPKEFNIAKVAVPKIQVKKYRKVKISQPRRRSLRIKGEKPSLEPDDSIDEDVFEDYKKYKIQKRSMPTIKLNTRRPQPKHPDDVTEEDVKSICYNSAGKDYDAVNGTTCHQCRQKTRDVKTVCKNPECFGARGQFCGFCLFNRYGEDVAHVLKIDKWSCPPCRNICNCSICRTRLGKRPTGILLPIALSQGFSNVKDFLMEKEPEIYAISDSDAEEVPKEETNPNYSSKQFPKTDNCDEKSNQNAKDFNITKESEIKSIYKSVLPSDESSDLQSNESNDVQPYHSKVRTDDSDEISNDDLDEILSDETLSDESDNIHGDVYTPVNEIVDKDSDASLSMKHSNDLDDSVTDDISLELKEILKDESKVREYVLSVIF